VFLTTSLVSALVSHNPLIGMLGLYYWGTGWLFIAALVGAWAIGRSLDERAAGLVQGAVLAAALLNAVVALLETVADLTALHLGRFGDRAPGLLGNPIHLGAFVGAAIAIVVPRAARAPWRWSGAVVVLAAGAQASGSRFAIVVVTGVAIWVFARHGARLGSVVAALIVMGLALGTAAAAVGGGSQIASSRVTVAAENGMRPRLDTWRTGIESLSTRPILGYGPGEFRVASAPRRTIAIARAEGADRVFVDAHNILIEYAVTTGAIGVIALVTWLGLVLRRTSGPLLVFSLAVLANHLVEPQSVRTTPVALLALGAASAASGSKIPKSVHRAARAIAPLSVAVAIVAGGWLLVGDYHLEQARLDFSPSHARVASRMLPWPESAEIRSRVYLFEGRVRRQPNTTARGITLLRDAAERDRSDPTWWHLLGSQLLAAGRVHEADSAFAIALRWNPVSVTALNGRGYAALAEGRLLDARRSFERSLAVVPNQPEIRRKCAEIDARTRLWGGPKPAPHHDSTKSSTSP
jgi:hypothetical protein